MKAEQLMEYLGKYNPESQVVITPTDEKERCFYENSNIIAITDSENPSLFVVMGEKVPFEELEG